MARYILDVGNVKDKFEAYGIARRISRLLEHKSMVIRVIDMSNTNQLYNEDDIEKGKTNELTEEQIESFNNQCNTF